MKNFLAPLLTILDTPLSEMDFQTTTLPTPFPSPTNVGSRRLLFHFVKSKDKDFHCVPVDTFPERSVEKKNPESEGGVLALGERGCHYDWTWNRRKDPEELDEVW